MQLPANFIWGYQQYFRVSIQEAAKGIFASLDSRLHPNVFIVGLLTTESSERSLVCIEPEDCGYSLDSFYPLQGMIQKRYKQDQDAGIQVIHPFKQHYQNRRTELRQIRNTIHRLLSEEDAKRSVVTFCSVPVMVNDYLVSVVLQLERDIFNSHYCLKKNGFDERGLGGAASLLDATVAEFLNGCARGLGEPDPGVSGQVLGRDYDEVVRSAGKHLMRTVELAGHQFEGVRSLFHTCNAISAMKYEGTEGVGRMIVARFGHPNIFMELSLQVPIHIVDYRAVRKLLEVATDEISLITDSVFVYGLGRVSGTYDPRNEDLFHVHYLEHYTWELRHVENIIMRVSYNQPSLPRMALNENKFRLDIRRIFGKVPSEAVDKLWVLALAATQQKHGTTLVISSRAEQEAQRLENQCVRINPIDLTPKIMRMVTAIDGAVLIDPHARCHAIGVILDGLASTKGTASRGARYNSAIRYVKTQETPCLAIVVSVDGSIDLVPDLMPQISKASLVTAISVLRDARSNKSFNVKQYNKIMDFLNEHRFYLSAEMCEEINQLKDDIDDRLRYNDVKIIFPDFTPHEDMNESYFLDE